MNDETRLDTNARGVNRRAGDAQRSSTRKDVSGDEYPKQSGGTQGADSNVRRTENWRGSDQRKQEPGISRN